MKKKKTIIIAEAGVNHNGDIKLAKEMIEKAKEAGADYVKFQTFKAEKLLVTYAEKANYQIYNTQSGENQFEMIKKLELTEAVHYELLEYCNKVGIGFLSSPFDAESVRFLAELGMDYIKIPSGEITNLPYLRMINETKIPTILSTGMSTMKEVEAALKELKDVSKLYVLHCNTEYPTPMVDVNLKAMLTLKEKLKVEVGYSDHTLGLEVPIAAVALGAKIIEKHFTLDKSMLGPDHKASLDPKELKAMISAIRNVEDSLGSGIKEPSPSEKKNITIARKSIVAKVDIYQGELFTPENITVKRPGTGISPMLWDSVIGSVSTRDYKKDELIE